MWCNKAILLFPHSPKKWQTPCFTELLSYCCTCSSSCFIVVLVPEDASRRSCSFWEEAITSLSLFSKAIFKSWTQCSDWRCCSSSSRNWKMTVRMQSRQVSLGTEESAAAEEFKHGKYLRIPSVQRTEIISSTSKPSLLLATEHKLCYVTIFYNGLSHPSTNFL